MGVFYDQCVDFSILGALFYIYPLTQNLCLFALSVDATMLINNAYKKTMLHRSCCRLARRCPTLGRVQTDHKTDRTR